MGRLERIQERKVRNTIIFYVAILILVIYFIFTYGFKLLLNSSSFVANLFPQPTSQPLTNVNNGFSAIDISTIPQATNSASIYVSGTILNFDTLDFFINGKKVKEIKTSADTFNEKIGDLASGNNNVYVMAKSTDNKLSKNTINYSVLYKSDPPKLDISTPGDNSTTNKQEIPINGDTDKEVYVHVNDLPVVVDANGSFQTSIRLKDGDNQIAITAEDVAGNVTSKSLKVTYKKDQ